MSSPLFDGPLPWPYESQWRWRRVLVVAVVMVVVGGFGLLTAKNAFGQNISGKVECAHGPVAGVFIEAERLPHAWFTGWEIQSGFAEWRSSPERSYAEFDYWLPYGGAYSIHFGCGPYLDSDRNWMYVARTPFMHDATPHWRCDNPQKLNFHGTKEVTECQRE